MKLSQQYHIQNEHSVCQLLHLRPPTHLAYYLPSKLLLTVLSNVSLMRKLDAIFVASVTVSLPFSAQTQSPYHIYCSFFPLNNLLLGTGSCQHGLVMWL